MKNKMNRRGLLIVKSLVLMIAIAFIFSSCGMPGLPSKSKSSEYSGIALQGQNALQAIASQNQSGNTYASTSRGATTPTPPPQSLIPCRSSTNLAGQTTSIGANLGSVTMPSHSYRGELADQNLSTTFQIPMNPGSTS